MAEEPKSPSWPSVQPVLFGDRVTLRPWHPNDAAIVYRICQDPDIQYWTRIPVPYERGHAAEFTGLHAPRSWSDGAGAAFAVTDSHSAEVLGSVGLVAIDAEDMVGEVGYWIAPAARRRGVATASIAMLASWALGEVGLARLELLIEPENIGSRKAAERAGAVLEGVMRSKAKNRAGQRCDLSLYAILPDTCLIDGFKQKVCGDGAGSSGHAGPFTILGRTG